MVLNRNGRGQSFRAFLIAAEFDGSNINVVQDFMVC